MQEFKIVRGLPKGDEIAAATLYWETFGGKFGRVLGRPDRAIAFFAETIHRASILSAYDKNGTLLGLAAFQACRVGFFKASFADLYRHYGLSAFWRIIPLMIIEREAPVGTLQMDGFCVRKNLRGNGIGSALLNEMFETAEANLLERVSLNVIKANPRARALYERLGFIAVEDQCNPVLRILMGFRYATQMVAKVSKTA